MWWTHKSHALGVLCTMCLHLNRLGSLFSIWGQFYYKYMEGTCESYFSSTGIGWLCSSIVPFSFKKEIFQFRGNNYTTREQSWPPQEVYSLQRVWRMSLFGVGPKKQYMCFLTTAVFSSEGRILWLTEMQTASLTIKWTLGVTAFIKGQYAGDPA